MAARTAHTFSGSDPPADEGMANLALTETPEESTSQTTGGYELAIANDSEGNRGGKVLGSRDFARYYRQNHRPQVRSRTTRLAELQQR